MSTTKRGLGRGLNALFADEEKPAFAEARHAAPEPAAITVPPAQNAEDGGLSRKTLPISMLRPGKFQPRKNFDDATLKELAESIAAHGIVQPLLVRPVNGGASPYEIICGERRWRAAQKAQLHVVPVVVREMDDEEAMQIALIENLQREDLNPLDEAEGYQRLMEEFAHTQEKLATAVGKSRSHIANMVRLLGLPASVRSMLRDGQLTTGHARALITAKNPEILAKEVIKNGLSVRETERLAMESDVREESKTRRKVKPAKDVDTLALEREMLDRLGMKVTIDTKGDGQKGTIKIAFKDFDELDKVVKRLS